MFKQFLGCLAASAAIGLSAETKPEIQAPSGTYENKLEQTFEFDGKTVKVPTPPFNPVPWSLQNMDALQKELEASLAESIDLLEMDLKVLANPKKQAELDQLKKMDWRAYALRFSTKKNPTFLVVQRKEEPTGKEFKEVYLFEGNKIIWLTNGSAFEPVKK